MRDNMTGETTGFWEIENSFGLGAFADKVDSTVAGMPVNSLQERIKLVQKEYDVQSLIALSQNR